MLKEVKLSKAVKYSDKRIRLEDVSIDNFITTDNLLQNKLGITQAINLPPQNGSIPSYKKENILVGNIRPYLKKIWFAEKDGGCSADVLVFDVNENYCPRFIYYALHRDDFFDHMMRGSKGTKMPRGDKSQILDFAIPNFNKTTQRQIASALSSLDAKIELNNKINTELEAMAKTIYDYWFVQFDFPYSPPTEGLGVVKPYKSSGGKMVYNEQLKREIPEGWEVKSLFDVCNVQYGFPFSTNYFNEEENGVPVIRIRDILENSVTNHSTENDIDKKYLIKKGDLLIGMDGNFHINYWTIEGCYLNQRVVKLSETILSNIYLKHQVEPFIKLREQSVSRTTVGHLSDKDLKAIKVIVPAKEIIESINQLYNSSLKKIIQNKNENQQLTQLRDWLLPMLMNGQVTVGAAQEMLGMVAEEKTKYDKSK